MPGAVVGHTAAGHAALLRRPEASAKRLTSRIRLRPFAQPRITIYQPAPRTPVVKRTPATAVS
jgi:hypothetical protein